MSLKDLARVSLSFLPTPLEPMPALSSHLGGPKIWIKRDDMTGLATGGNKARKLEFLMADALENGADTVLTFGAVDSNHCRMTAAAARKLGLESFLVLSGLKSDRLDGNLLLDEIFGSQYLFLPDFNDPSRFDEMRLAVFNIVQDLTEQGRNVYMIPPGGSTPLGDVGYYVCAVELFEQARELGFRIDHIFTAMGTGGTHAGLLAGVKCLDMPSKVFGIAVNKEGSLDDLGLPPVEVIVGEICELIGEEPNATPDDVIIDYSYYGKAYGVPTPECIEAIKLVARAEGILLDPTYTGKTMAGLIDMIQNGRFGKDENIVFMHTGGYPGIFPHGEAFRERL
jgi:L-cysteate sulfo-lyase